MNSAIILAGGKGKRMGLGGVPKQYLMWEEKPLILYSLQAFQQNKKIDRIYIAADRSWRDFISGYLGRYEITKFTAYADPGTERQLSIYNALLLIEERKEAQKDDIVVIHDAARPLVTQELIDQCLEIEDPYDGILPVLPVKDTCYISKDGNFISDVPDREKLYFGQAPESFRFGPYLSIHKSADQEVLSKVRGSSEFAFFMGLKIKMVPGDENNFKITTNEDFDRFCIYDKIVRRSI